MPNKIYNLYNKTVLNKMIGNAIIFGGIAILFFGLMRKNFYVEFYYEEGVFWITSLLLNISKFILNIFTNLDLDIFGKYLCDLDKFNGLVLDRGCVGRNLMLTFVGFMLIIPYYKPIKKILHILLGLSIIILANSLRLALMLIIMETHPSIFDFMHEIGFKILIYGIVFLIWVFICMPNSPLGKKAK